MKVSLLIALFLLFISSVFAGGGCKKLGDDCDGGYGEQYCQENSGCNSNKKCGCKFGDSSNGYCSPPPSTAPPATTQPGAHGDPHFIGFHNQRYDFHGFKDATFLIYSDPQIFINAELVDGSWKKKGSTYMGALGIQLGPNKMTVSAHEGIHFLPFTRISERESIIKLDGCGHVKIDGTFKNGVLVQWKRVIIDYEEYDIVITRSVPAESKTPEESAYLNIQKISIPKSVIKASGVLGQSLTENTSIDLTSKTWFVKGDILSTKCKATTFTNLGNRYTTDNCPEAAQTFYVKRVASSMD